MPEENQIKENKTKAITNKLGYELIAVGNDLSNDGYNSSAAREKIESLIDRLRTYKSELEEPNIILEAAHDLSSVADDLFSIRSDKEKARKLLEKLGGRISIYRNRLAGPQSDVDIYIDQHAENIVHIRGPDGKYNNKKLGPTESKLFRFLYDHEGRILENDAILWKVWGSEYVGEKNFVKLYIRYLRKKIEPDPSNPVYIHTERGHGYRFVNHRNGHNTQKPI